LPAAQNIKTDNGKLFRQKLKGTSLQYIIQEYAFILLLDEVNCLRKAIFFSQLCMIDKYSVRKI